MRRKHLLTLTAGGALAFGGLCAMRATSSADAAREAVPPAKAATAVPMPITHINLFTNGVGHVLRQGTVTDNARIDLPFAVADINDLLKSVLVRDLDGGVIRAIACDSHDPVEKTLAGFAVNLTGNPSFAAILNQSRGEQVEVTLAPGGALPGSITGSVIGVERKKRSAGKADVEEVEQLNLWCRDGVRSVKLADVQRINFLNPALKDEVRQALDTLARTHDTRKKTVSLVCAGEGRRRVQAGYVVTHPVWKTSYRLALGKDEKLALQAWALVENPTDEDWKDVRLALIAGQPVSFRMDLYQPLYVHRPLVDIDRFANLRPPTYDGSLRDWQTKTEEGKALPRGRFDVIGEAPGKGAGDLRVKAGALGDFFQYLIDERISLPRQKSALFPIARKTIAGTRVSIYNEKTLAKFPMLGVRFKNNTGLHLSSGPITIYDGDSYAGDAIVPNLQPGEERLLSYAIDLGTEVLPEATRTAERMTAIKVQRGLLTATMKLTDARKYRIKNRSPQDRVVLIEYPYRADYKLVDTIKPVDVTRSVYRFEVKVPAGKSVDLTVTEEKVVAQVVRLASSDDEVIRFYLSSTVASPALKAALQKAVALRNKVVETERAIARTAREERELVADQTRLRDNMGRVPPSSAVYKRYLAKLEQQEGQIEKLQEAIKKLRATKEQQLKEQEDYLSGLSVE